MKTNNNKTILFTAESEATKELKSLTEHFNPPAAIGPGYRLNLELPEIKESSIYKETQDSTHIVVSNLFRSDGLLQCIAKLSATSSTVQSFKVERYKASFNFNWEYVLGELKASSSIVSLELNNCSLKYGNCSKIGSYIAKITNLNYVNLSHNRLGNSIIDIALDLVLPNLKSIDFSENGASVEAKAAVTKIFNEYNTHPQFVNYSLFIATKYLISEDFMPADIGCVMLGMFESPVEFIL